MRNTTLKLATAGLMITVALIFPLALLSQTKTKKAAASPGSAVEGQKVFAKQCAICHFPDKADKKIGPGLKGLFKNKLLPNTKRPATEANVREQIGKGSPKGMPAFAGKLTPAESQNLLAYLKTL